MLKQADRISFAHGSHFTSEAAIECAEQVISLMPSPELNKCYFLSEGSTRSKLRSNCPTILA
jgi:adenosylmethionine-8-amino-7-oxononanoate aminotransferase